MNSKIKMVGAAIDACASTVGCADTPDLLKDNLSTLGMAFEHIYKYSGATNDINGLTNYFTGMATHCKQIVNQTNMPIIIGGDHSCAIGSWSGVSAAVSESGNQLGLIWIDAHMDAHTPETSPSGNIHGMPIATLMGYGFPQFLSILHNNPKIDPKHIVIIGVRSFEGGEAALLKQLGVKVYYNYDVEDDGIAKVLQDSWDYLTSKVDRVGLSIDLDGFDPKDVPGVGTLEDNGIDFAKFLNSLSVFNWSKVAAVEITEGNCHIDNSGKTMNCIMDIIKQVLVCKQNIGLDDLAKNPYVAPGVGANYTNTTLYY